VCAYTNRHADVLTYTHTLSPTAAFQCRRLRFYFFLIFFYFQSYCSFSVQAVEALTAAGVELQVIECDKEVRGIEMQVSHHICPYICP
jgi:glutaredoxin